jgi:hypothetical protein
VSDSAEQLRVLPEQVPAEHASLTVQKAPSSQIVPSDFGCAKQVSFVSLQVPSLHWSDWPEQSRVEPEQLPAVHWSLTVQNAPSSQVVASALGALVQRLFASLHTPSLH